MRRVQIVLDQLGRDGERVAVVVEAVATLVGREVGGGVVAVRLVEQFANGVGIFAVVETVDDQRPRIGLAGGGRHVIVDPVHQQLAFAIGGTVLHRSRRHAAAAHLVGDLAPEVVIGGAAAVKN